MGVFMEGGGVGPEKKKKMIPDSPVANYRELTGGHFEYWRVQINEIEWIDCKV